MNAAMALMSGRKRNLTGPVAQVTKALALGLSAFHLWAAFLGTLNPYIQVIVFFAGASSLVFLVYAPSRETDPHRPPGLIDWCWIGATLVAGGYLLLQAERLVTRWAFVEQLSSVDKLAATIFVLVTFEITRRTLGPVLCAIMLVCIGYTFGGHLLGGLLYHPPISLNNFLDLMVFTANGLFSEPASVTSSYVFVFMIFGAFLSASGASDFFLNFARTVTGGSVGSSAKIAVVSSGLYGMVSGSSVSDVVTTGSFTIPAMKKEGFPGQVAAAVEATASTGGGLVPPVMGAAAFIMAAMIGVPYVEIVKAAWIPAMLYYAGVFFQVHGLAARYATIEPPTDTSNSGRLSGLLQSLASGWTLIIPVAALVVLLFSGRAASYAAGVAIFCSAVIVVIQTRFRVTDLIQRLASALADASYRVVSLVGAVTVAGLIFGVLGLTGLNESLYIVIYTVVGDNLALVLIATALLTIVLGMGMPTVGAYIVAAVICGPLLAELAVADLPAHLFIFYMACLSAITPPIMVAVFVAGSIADVSPMSIIRYSLPLSVAGLILPFFFVYRPGILLTGGLNTAMVDTVLGIAFVAAFCAAAAGNLGSRSLSPLVRIVLPLLGVLMLVPNDLLALAAAVAVFAVLAFKLLTKTAVSVSEAKVLSN